MSERYKIRDQDKLYFVTFTVFQWLDVFTRKEYKDIFVESLRFCQSNKGLEVWAYVIMSNHVHLIVGRHGEPPLKGLFVTSRKFTSVQIIEAITSNEKESRRELLLWLFERAGRKNSSNVKFQFWQHGNHPIELNTKYKASQRLNYIHQNPVKAGIVSAPEHYLYSSARNYAEEHEVLLDVMLL